MDAMENVRSIHSSMFEEDTIKKANDEFLELTKQEETITTENYDKDKYQNYYCVSFANKPQNEYEKREVYYAMQFLDEMIPKEGNEATQKLLSNIRKNVFCDHTTGLNEFLKFKFEMVQALEKKWMNTIVKNKPIKRHKTSYICFNFHRDQNGCMEEAKAVSDKNGWKTFISQNGYWTPFNIDIDKMPTPEQREKDMNEVIRYYYVKREQDQKEFEERVARSKEQAKQEKEELDKKNKEALEKGEDLTLSITNDVPLSKVLSIDVESNEPINVESNEPIENSSKEPKNVLTI